MKPHFGLAVTPSIHLIRPLGRGGMGSVWVAEHRALKTEVAVKFLSSELLDYEGAVARFSQEATSAAQIKSPHGVHIYDHGVLDDELPFIVMELLQGEDLGARIRRSGPLRLGEVSALLLQLSRVLKKAHELGIVHRDIKPDNIMVLRDYGDFFVKLIDFGIAKVMSGGTGVTATGVVVGTPDYMCPEQFHSARDVGPGADLWSLSTVMYHSLTGERPFPGETLPAVIMAVEKGKFRLPYQSGQIGNPAVDAFFERALARDPRDRFPSLEQMVEAWQSAAKDAPAQVTGSLDLSSTPTRDDRPGRARKDQEVDAMRLASESKGTRSFPPEPVLGAIPTDVSIVEGSDSLLGPQGNDSPTVGALPRNVRRAEARTIPRWSWFALAGVVAALIVAVALKGGDAGETQADAGEQIEGTDQPKPPSPSRAEFLRADSASPGLSASPSATAEPAPEASSLPGEATKATSGPSEKAPGPATSVPKPSPAPARSPAPKSEPAPRPVPSLKDRGF